MPDLIVSSDIDTLLSSASTTAARTNLGLGAADTVEFGAFIPPSGTTAEIDAVTTAEIGQVMVDTDRNRQVRFTGASAYVDINPLSFNNSIFIATNGTDTRAGLSVYDANMPYLTLQAAHDAAAEGDMITMMPGTYAGGLAATKSIKIQLLAGALSNGTVTNPTSGKVVEIYGDGRIGTINANGGEILCKTDVWAVALVSNGGILRLRDAYIRGAGSNGIVNVNDVAPASTLDIRNCRIKANTANTPAIEINYLFGGSTYFIENTILEANGTADSINLTGAPTSFGSINFINVASNKAPNANVTQAISSMLIDAAVTAE